MPRGIKLPSASFTFPQTRIGLCAFAGIQFGLRAAPSLWPRGLEARELFWGDPSMQINLKGYRYKALFDIGE